LHIVVYAVRILYVYFFWLGIFLVVGFCLVGMDNVEHEEAIIMDQNGLSRDDKTFGMLSHLLALAGCLIPLGNILGPLVIWLIKKDQSAFVNDQGKESINFQISITIYGIISAILIIVVIGILTSIALGIFWLVLIIVASVKANEGQLYRYPLTIRFLK
jgi:uncharacterized Tic20 family protein